MSRFLFQQNPNQQMQNWQIPRIFNLDALSASLDEKQSLETQLGAIFQARNQEKELGGMHPSK